jgi:L-fuculose-phosphate aldolase
MTQFDHSYKKYKKEVAGYMRRLYKKNLTTASGGNISIKLKNGHILITPSGTDKGKIKGKQICILSENGQNLTEGSRVSMETAMHLAIYETRPEVTAIVHAHPPIASAFTALDKDIDCTLTAEARAVIGEPKKAPYALMGTAELATAVAKVAANDNVILLQNHGILCMGETMLMAFDRMEVLESCAKMTVVAELMKGVKSLSREQLKAIDVLMGKSPEND